ncbi:hypothetical protein COT42_09005 [Candidatus Saganbacteria bacterium CG08_land_8_20_14_0_20_45_16]|uniref:Uncharacterized protein n=1 Tax=Candidatus Saganbacteria bacterium CG08_land_8_20_14_0_20_45_16 TaxID=2014293 RepID=A0A2H0XT30_UNCSA|nr:MAG: hypothetical protein COT42_09005 [Candidatus Saganbacteria bacterium CG08_land_8_20_14_0_20_45_16]
MNKGFTILAAVFIMVAVAFIAIATSTFLAADSILAARNFESLRAFYIAEAAVGYTANYLRPNGDWTVGTGTPLGVAFAGGQATVNFIATEAQRATIEVQAVFGSARRTVRVTLSSLGRDALPDAFQYAIYWDNSESNSDRLRLGWTTWVHGDVAAKGGVKVLPDSWVQPGTIYVAQGYDVDIDPGGVASWEVDPNLPDFPVCDYTYYDTYMSQYRSQVPCGASNSIDWTTDQVLSGNIITAKRIEVHGNAVIRGYGTLVADQYIDIHDNVVISPEGGAIVFICNSRIAVFGNTIVRSGPSYLDFGTHFYTNGGDVDFYANLDIQKTLAMSDDTISVFRDANSPYADPVIGGNSVFYVPEQNDYIELSDSPEIQGSVISRGRLMINGGKYTGLVYCDNAWGTLVNSNPYTTFFHGALVSRKFRSERLQSVLMEWDETYLPTVKPPGLGGNDNTIAVIDWQEIYN